MSAPRMLYPTSVRMEIPDHEDDHNEVLLPMTSLECAPTEAQGWRSLSPTPSHWHSVRHTLTRTINMKPSSMDSTRDFGRYRQPRFKNETHSCQVCCDIIYMYALRSFWCCWHGLSGMPLWIKRQSYRPANLFMQQYIWYTLRCVYTCRPDPSVPGTRGIEGEVGSHTHRASTTSVLQKNVCRSRTRILTQSTLRVYAQSQISVLEALNLFGVETVSCMCSLSHFVYGFCSQNSLSPWQMRQRTYTHTFFICSLNLFFTLFTCFSFLLSHQ